MDDSILNSVKSKINLTEDNTEFDNDIIDYVNGVFGTLNQLGLGPTLGFEIHDASATWESFTGGDLRYNAVKTYVAKKVQQVFDPASTSFTQASMEKIVAELEWRLNLLREELTYGVPVVPVLQPPIGGGIFDGGKP
jgi:hypothetical protein